MRTIINMAKELWANDRGISLNTPISHENTSGFFPDTVSLTVDFEHSNPVSEAIVYTLTEAVELAEAQIVPDASTVQVWKTVLEDIQ